ncbi:MAG: hypothetical protein ACRC2T_06530 [Thermoguttaceae bacterium]
MLEEFPKYVYDFHCKNATKQAYYVNILCIFNSDDRTAFLNYWILLDEFFEQHEDFLTDNSFPSKSWWQTSKEHKYAGMVLEAYGMLAHFEKVKAESKELRKRIEFECEYGLDNDETYP